MDAGTGAAAFAADSELPIIKENPLLAAAVDASLVAADDAFVGFMKPNADP